MNILEMMARVAGEEDAQNDDDGLTNEQIVIRLREIEALRTEEHAFVPGQILQHKYPNSCTMNDAQRPHMFLRYLERPICGLDMIKIDTMTSSAATHVADCEVAVIRRDGLRMTYFVDSREFRPHPEFPTEA